jgi:hypothetical protein
VLGRELLVAWLHLAVLWAFGVAKPLFDVLSDDAAFFVARGNTRGDILVFSFALILLVPTALVAIELLFFRGPRTRRAVHVLFVAGLMALFALQVLVDLVGWDSRALLPTAAVAGALGAIAYARWRGLRSVLTVLSPAPLLFLVLFLLFSPVSKLVLPQEEEALAVPNVAGDTPVVIIVFDELSGISLLDAEGRIDGRRLPNFSKLAAESTWYRNATTVADVTTQALPAMLTGEAPDRDKLPTASDHPRNLFNILGPSYTLDVHESATQLCPERLCGDQTTASTPTRLSSLAEDLAIVSLHQLLPDDLDRKLPAVDRTFGGFREGGGGGAAANSAGIPNQAFVNRKQTFESFVSSLHSERGRSLHFFHAQLPHTPFQYLPSGQQYPQNGPTLPGLDGPRWQDNLFLVLQAQQRYLLQAGFVDRLLGRVIRRLKAAGTWERSLVVVAADHGVSFVPGQTRRYVNRRNFADIASIPLFIKAPGQQAARVDDSPVRTVDLVPTIARYLDLRLPWAVEGRPLQEERGRSNEPLSVIAFAGGEVEREFGEFIRLRDAGARWLTALLGESGDPFKLGPRGDLPGRSVRAFRVRSLRGAQVEFDAPRLYASVDPAAAVVPVLITGQISGGVEDGDALAIAINDEIAAVAEAYRLEGNVRFSAIAPPDAFRAGRNVVRVFAVEGSGASTRLAAIGAGQEARIATRGGREFVILPSGDKAELTRDGVSGSVDRITHEDDQLSVHGWAADPRARRAADRILIFDSRGFLVSGSPSLLRADIAELYGERAEKSGFQLRTVVENAEELADPEKLRFIAVAGNRASELTVPGGAYVGPGP